MANEAHKKFVESMLESSEKKFSKPQPNVASVDQKEVEEITEGIRKKLQQR